MSSIHSKKDPDSFLRAVALGSLIVAAIAPPAHAAPPDPAPVSTPAESRAHAKRLFEQGQAHYDLGEYDEAIAAFREAYEISSAPALLFNIAQSHRLKGDCPRAIQVYRHFVRLDPSSPHRSSAEAQIDTLSAQCEHKSDAAAPPSPSASPEKAGDAGATVAASVATTSPVMPRARTGGTQRYVVLGLVSGGLALVGAAAALHVWNDSRFDTWQNEDRTISTAPVGANDLRARQAANNELLGDIRRTDAVSVILAATGGASLVAGGTLFFAWQPPTPSNNAGGIRLSWTASW
jgi:tetratricopeptide (TPR) repeat protein